MSKIITLNVVFRSFNKIRNTFRFKDQILKYMNSKMIYKFKCNIFNDSKIVSMIGETKRHFLVRENEHLGKSILTEKNLRYTGIGSTAIRKHCYNHCHTNVTSPFLKLKPSLNVAKESMLLYLFENDSSFDLRVSFSCYYGNKLCINSSIRIPLLNVTLLEPLYNLLLENVGSCSRMIIYFLIYYWCLFITKTEVFP